ncbi:MAG TPA: mechanosensitive ion channel domain-containing protein [Pirellulales bacterium]|nr:mechanosensitive ion channel domain-containing protein [Pirellulales bacterium]
MQSAMPQTYRGRIDCGTLRLLAGGRLAAAIFSAFVSLALDARAQSPSDASGPGKPPAANVVQTLNIETTPAAIQQRLEQIKSANELSEEVKQKIVDAYQSALLKLEEIDKLAAQTAEFDKQAKQAPAALQDARRQLENPPEEPGVAIPSGTTLAQIESTLSQLQTELADAQDALTQIDAEPQRRAERRQNIPKELEKAGIALAESQKSLEIVPPADEPEALTRARLTKLSAEKLAAEKLLAMLKSERESYNAEDELLPKQRDLAERMVNQKKMLVEKWQEILHDLREDAAAEKLKQAVREKKDTCPELRGVAAENEDLAKRVKAVSDDIAAADRQINELTSSQNDLKREFPRLQAKYDSLGQTPEIGPLLLQYRSELRRQSQRLEQLRLPASATTKVRLELATLPDQRKKLNDLPAATAEIIHTLDLSGPHPPSREELDYDLRELLRNRCDLLDSLTSAYTRYSAELTDLVIVEKQLSMELEQEANYIDERILWVRSTSTLAWHDVAAAAESLRWYARPLEWTQVVRLLADEFRSHPVSAFAGGASILLLFVGQRPMRRRVRELGEQAARGSTDNMTPTFRVLALTILMSLPWSALLIYLGWRLSETPRATELALALASGLKVTGIVLLPMELIRHVCRGRGLGHAHFGWSESSLKTLRRHLRWFMLLGLPLTFAAAATHALESDRWRDSLGRMLFIAAMLLLAAFIFRVFRPLVGILAAVVAGRGPWPDRLNDLLLPLSIGGPAALAVLAAWGYFYTAQQLAARLLGTAWLLVGLSIAGALALRWVLVSRRRLAMQQARQRRAAALAAAQASESSDAPTHSAAQDDALDLTAINAQTRRFVQTAVVAALVVGLWGIWADVLPALSILDIQLWPTRDANGDLVSINVSHLLLAIVLFMTMLIAGRNFPGLLEIAILQRLPLEPATRYAITTLSRYAITVLGVVAVCGTLGITWDKVHWLIAAVSVGLGFGLQEIFANFVSGLIILFERPVRVGDIVTVGDVTGVVSRIRIRATLIVDWDRKELIVPNKEFITGHVLNWTLSDQMNRVVVNVGVAYGSDAARVRQLLLKIAAENEFVLNDPPPMATFEGFGDSSLDFVLRCYLPNLENRLAVTHDLHANIHDAFQAEGIEIPFPQRDLNVRHVDAAHAGTVPLSGKAPAGAARQQKQA